MAGAGSPQDLTDAEGHGQGSDGISRRYLESGRGSAGPRTAARPTRPSWAVAPGAQHSLSDAGAGILSLREPAFALVKLFCLEHVLLARLSI